MPGASQPSSLPPGRRLFGRYVIQRVLGQGGFAITYLAKDERSRNRPVAVKELFPGEMVRRSGDSVVLRPHETAEDFDFVRRQFLQEAKTICGFNHPNLIRGYEVFEENHTAYVSMRYESGSSLRHHLRVKGTFRVDPASVAKLLEGMLSGLKYVHGAGWLHCDLKPANVFLGRDFVPIILDFGAARHKVRQRFLDRSEFLVPYTPHYSPVEQDPENHLDFGPWTDIYQVGALIYRCVSGGKVPASGERLKSDSYLPVAEILSEKKGYPRGFCDALDWSLRVMPVDRPQTISEWRSKLDPSLDSMRNWSERGRSRESSAMKGNDPTPTRRSSKFSPATDRNRQKRSKGDSSSRSRRNHTWLIVCFVVLLATVAFLAALVLMDSGLFR